MREVSKRGQLTIFIITGVVFVVGFLFYFLIRSGYIENLTGGGEINSNSFLESCLEERISEAVEIISHQGGNIEPKLYKTFRFANEKESINISYLCYNQNYYDACVNQAPALITHIESEVKDYISDDVNECFNSLAENLEKQDYVVEKTYRGFDVNLDLNTITVNIDGKLELTSTEESLIQDKIGVVITNNLYDLALVAHEIINSEAEYCTFNKESFMLMYPDIKVELYTLGNGEGIYTVKYRAIDNFFRFAVRGCIIQ
ncbi:MAG: hypothetical protein OQK82_01975 [Candidatus Pacearchaeota archaeon]|nr:hypothetical protein [Candidatus Pacearchaeota archaeon]